MGESIPQHIAIIMDGNGRWAKARGLSRSEGHLRGARIFKKVLKHAKNRGVKVITLYAFSSENWGRPADEVAVLMDIFRSYLKHDVSKLAEEGIRVSFIGDRNRFAPDLKEQMDSLEEKTRDFNQFRVVVALGYGARDDLVAAARKMAHKIERGELTADKIDAACVRTHLSTADMPDPDLLIRTSGEQRLSNFLLWELAYAEFFWSPVMWPDFDEKALDDAIESYQKRQRRFGLVK